MPRMAHATTGGTQAACITCIQFPTLPDFCVDHTTDFVLHVEATATFFSGLWWNLCTVRTMRAHYALLLDYVPPEEPPGTPLGNTLRPKLDWRGP